MKHALSAIIDTSKSNGKLGGLVVNNNRF